MPSTYSSLLRLELIAAGEQDGSWGGTTNTNLGTLIEHAIAGVASVTHDDSANYSLTTANGTSDEARNAVLEIGGTLTANRNVVCPTSDKVYIVYNGTSGGFDITIKTSGGTGVTVPNGATRIVYCDGTNVVSATGSSLGYTLTVAEGGTGGTTASAARNNLGVVIGTDVQAYDALLQAIAGLSMVADRYIYGTGSDAVALGTITSFARTILDDADAATVRGTIGAQASDNLLTSIAGLTFGTDNYIYGTGSDTAAVGTISSEGRTFVAKSDLSATSSAEGLVEKATAAEVAAKTADKFPDAATLGSAPYAAKVWCSYEMVGTASIRGDEGVASLTDNGTGDATLTFDTAFADTNYGVSAAQQQSTGDAVWNCGPRNGHTGLATGTLRLLTTVANNANGFATDVDFQSVSCFGSW